MGNVFSWACMSVCVFVQAITFGPLRIRTLFLIYRLIYVLTISRSSLSIKVNVVWEKMIVYLFQLLIPLYVATGNL